MDSAYILKKLIKFDTSNPPGNEKECILWIKEILENAGLKTAVFQKDNNRPNLVAWLEGQKKAPPLMLYGHIDVAPTAGQTWKYPPFEGLTKDGSVWGRGALDMKGGIAMMLAVLLRISGEEYKPPGDIIFCVLSDEESGGEMGAEFMVQEHPEIFRDVKYALGEFGGFPIYIGKKCFYLIQTGEKQRCWMKATLKGPGGHGAQRFTGGAVARLGEIINSFDKKRLPVHITPIAREMVETFAKHLPFHSGFLLKQVLNPVFTDLIINMLGEKGDMFDPVLHNTANITMVQGGSMINVIPSEISFKMDGRILPGFSSEQMINEIREIAGRDFSIEVLNYESCPPTPDMGMFDTLSDILTSLHPGAIPVPFLLPGITDARFFSRLGIQTYGFTPMNLPPDFSLGKMIHAEDERIPEYCLEFGENAIYEAVKRYN